MSFHYNPRQVAKSDAKLRTIQAQSVKVTNTLLAGLAVKRDIHLANLR